jgi:hypothetical protein
VNAGSGCQTDIETGWNKGGGPGNGYPVVTRGCETGRFSTTSGVIPSGFGRKVAGSTPGVAQLSPHSGNACSAPRSCGSTAPADEIGRLRSPALAKLRLKPTRKYVIAVWLRFARSLFSQPRYAGASRACEKVTVSYTSGRASTAREHFVGLLDCARASSHGTEFAQRLATAGFISQKAVQYCSELQKIIGDLGGRAVTAADLWPFLRVLHVLSLDLHSSTRQTEAHIKSLLAHTVSDGADAAGQMVISLEAGPIPPDDRSSP